MSGAAAAIVQHQAPEILQRVSLMLGEGTVGRLRIVQGPVRAHATRPQAKRRRHRGPLDAAAEKTLAEGLKDQPDGSLKTALTTLGREILRGRDG